MNQEKIELHALIELFGHQKVAGTISEYSFGPSTFIRIDVPETEQQPAFTRMVNPSAVYAINPVTREVMMELAKNIQSKPIESWDIRKMHEKLLLLAEKSNAGYKNDTSE